MGFLTTRPEGSSRELVFALAVGAALAALTLALGYFEGGMEGVCWGESAFYREHLAEAAGWRAEGSLWPPGQSCVALARNGALLARETYPQLQDWILALTLFALPCGLGRPAAIPACPLNPLEAGNAASAHLSRERSHRSNVPRAQT